MADVSAFGAVVNIQASNTFPNGFNVTQFADDADPFDIPAIVVNDKAMGVNGKLITWSRATPTELKIAVVNGSVDDQNLGIILEANRVSAGKTSALDIINVSVVYPSGRTLLMTNGVITGGMIGSSVSTSGRLKTKTYDFTFENTSETNF